VITQTLTLTLTIDLLNWKLAYRLFLPLGNVYTNCGLTLVSHVKP